MTEISLTAEEIRILKHTLGVRTTMIESYRNYFMTGPDTTDYPVVEEITKKGFMQKQPYKLDEINESYIYSVTNEGKEFLREILS